MCQYCYKTKCSSCHKLMCSSYLNTRTCRICDKVFDKECFKSELKHKCVKDKLLSFEYHLTNFF